MDITVKGIRIHVSFLFVCLVALYTLFTPTPDSVFFLLAVILHEVGHLLAMLLSGELPAAVELRSFGIKICRRQTFLPPLRELLILSAGPFVNLLLSAVFFAMGKGFHNAAMMNLILALFNLFPVGCLDGGNILRCLLELRLPPYLSQIISVCVAAVFLLLFFAAGALIFFGGSHSPSLLITAVYLTVTLIKDISG